MLVELKKDERLYMLGLDRDEAIKYVRARKNDVQRSLQLVRNHAVSCACCENESEPACDSCEMRLLYSSFMSWLMCDVLGGCPLLNS